jgi:hypothetical protein
MAGLYREAACEFQSDLPQAGRLQLAARETSEGEVAHSAPTLRVSRLVRPPGSGVCTVPLFPRPTLCTRTNTFGAFEALTSPTI